MLFSMFLVDELNDIGICSRVLSKTFVIFLLFYRFDKIKSVIACIKAFWRRLQEKNGGLVDSCSTVLVCSACCFLAVLDLFRLL